jgi:hypothetical protein
MFCTVFQALFKGMFSLIFQVKLPDVLQPLQPVMRVPGKILLHHVITVAVLNTT